MKKKSLDLIWAEHQRWGHGDLMVRGYGELWLVYRRRQTGYLLRNVAQTQTLFIQSHGVAQKEVWSKVDKR